MIKQVKFVVILVSDQQVAFGVLGQLPDST